MTLKSKLGQGFERGSLSDCQRIPNKSGREDREREGEEEREGENETEREERKKIEGEKQMKNLFEAKFFKAIFIILVISTQRQSFCVDTVSKP